jgi:hypothetical protein
MKDLKLLTQEQLKAILAHIAHIEPLNYWNATETDFSFKYHNQIYLAQETGKHCSTCRARVKRKLLEAKSALEALIIPEPETKPQKNVKKSKASKAN